MTNFDDIFSAPTTETTDSRANDNDFDVEAWAQKKQSERDSVFAALDEHAVKVGTNPDALRSYLDVQSRFTSLSANNALLVSAQRPDATQLASFDDWHKQEVSILAGEKAIAILEQGGSFTRDDGTEGRYTNIGKVFDISQTSAEVTKTEAAPRDIRDLLKSLAAHQSASIEMTDDLPDGRPAMYEQESHTVYVRRGMDGNDMFLTLTRELSTAALCRDGSTPTENSVASYAASYMLCKKYGVDTRSFNLEQLSRALGTLDAKGIRQQLGRARNTAEGISYQMEKTLNPQQRTDKNAR